MQYITCTTAVTAAAAGNNIRTALSHVGHQFSVSRATWKTYSLPLFCHFSIFPIAIFPKCCNYSLRLDHDENPAPGFSTNSIGIHVSDVFVNLSWRYPSNNYRRRVDRRKTSTDARTFSPHLFLPRRLHFCLLWLTSFGVSRNAPMHNAVMSL